MAKLKKRADGRYQISLYLGKDENGKAIRKTVYGATQKETEQKADALRARIGKGLNLTSNYTVEKWAAMWLENKKLHVGATSQEIYKTVVDRLCLYVGRMRISEVLPLHLQRIIDDLAVENPNTGRPASARLMQYQRDGMHQIFDYARKNRLIDTNPADDLTLPRAEKQRRVPITEHERELILSVPHRTRTAAFLMLFAGLRRGEVLPLLWSDVDLDSGTISVNKAVEFVDRKPRIKLPKTRSGIRTVFIPDRLIEYLRQLPKDNDLVFPDLSGGIFGLNAWRKAWESYLVDLSAADTGVNKYSPNFRRTVNFTPHQLRHTFCTDLYAAGVDVLTARDQMGHSSINVTLEIYTHLNEQKARAEMQKLNPCSQNVVKSDAASP